MTQDLFQKIQPNFPGIFEGGGSIYAPTEKNIESFEFDLESIDLIKDILASGAIDSARFVVRSANKFLYWARTKTIQDQLELTPDSKLFTQSLTKYFHEMKKQPPFFLKVLMIC